MHGKANEREARVAHVNQWPTRFFPGGYVPAMLSLQVAVEMHTGRITDCGR